MVGSARSLLLCALFQVLFSQSSFAQYSGAAYLVPPELIQAGGVIYPQDAAVAGNEAWVTVSMTVKADGTPADITIVDGFYSPPFEKVTLAAAKTWQFRPATENGTPTDWNDFRYTFAFYYTNIPGGAYPAFSGNYSKVNALLEQNDYAGAKQKIEELFKTDLSPVFHPAESRVL